MRFTLSISLDNDEHATDGYLAIVRSLDKLGSQFDHVFASGTPTPGDGGGLRDVNGNTIGGWSVGPEDPEAAILAARALVEVYERGEGLHGVDWFDLDEAHRMAVAAVKR